MNDSDWVPWWFGFIAGVVIGGMAGFIVATL